jgi:hypothetical protein
MAEETRTDIKPESDIYTILAIVATIFLAAGTIFGAVRMDVLFGTWLPF